MHIDLEHELDWLISSTSLIVENENRVWGYPIEGR